MPLLFLAAVAAAPLADMPAAKPVCQKIDRHPADTPKVVRVHPLDQEPPADQIVAVLHTENGCSKPIVVRENVGGPADGPHR